VRQVKPDESCWLKGTDHGKCSCAMSLTERAAE